MGVREVGEKEISMRRDQYPFKVRRNLVDFLFFVLCAEQEHRRKCHPPYTLHVDGCWASAHEETNPTTKRQCPVRNRQYHFDTRAGW